MIDFDPGYLTALAGSAAAAIIVAGAGGFMTDTGPWYRSMKFPGWKPPDWAFGPIWTLVLVCATLGAAKGLQAAPDADAYWQCVAVLGVNAVLNILWNAIFFAMRRPDWAFVEVIIFWLSILAVMVVLGNHSLAAALYFLPYLVWVAIASLLNWRIVVLNRPFGALQHD
ncbi:MAG: hypothetical protein RLZ07_552 [Pseudomonadota bacterium]|jgi:tryptophan-rich sensory protein